MTNLYLDNTDKRQTEDTQLNPDNTLFRKRYRALSESDLALHDSIKDTADQLAKLFSQIKTKEVARTGEFLTDLTNNQTANVTLAIRHLEDAVYRAVKALTS